MPNISIIIPTYKHLWDCLHKCCISIIEYTELSNLEVLVVANGCGDDGTKEYVEGLGKPFRLVWIEEQIGYTKAVNVGIGEAKGEYIVLLNNDTIILNQPRNQWIDMLMQPFFEDEKMGITGPMKTFCPHAARDFLIFFCVMTKRKYFDEIGLLDECFAPAYGEDVDWICRLVDVGYKLKQVPQDSDIYYADKRMTGAFQIWHDGNRSYKDWPDGEKLIQRNSAILKERYNSKKSQISMEIQPEIDATLSDMVNIEKAKQCDGFMGIEELTWLAEQAKNCHGIFLEIGSWHGKSSRAIADNLPEDGKLICVDTWNGSAVEQDTNHASAKGMDGDAACLEFFENMYDHIVSGKVLPLRMSSKNAAHGLMAHTDIRPKIIFIDAGHEEHEVREDIQCWLPLVKDGGTLCGHDYYYHDNIWVGVKKAVDELLPNITIPHNTSIWVYKKEAREPIVIDAFPFNNELEILDIRFATLYPVVDRFVIVEAMTTHGGKSKELVFQNNLNRYQKYLHKVTYLVIQEFPPMDESASVTDKSWTRERYQRNYIMEALKDCRDDDVIIVSDVDEIPYKEAVEEFKNPRWQEDIASLQMDLYYYNQYTKANEKWYEAKILKYHKLKELSPCGARYNRGIFAITNAGCHLSYFGGVNKIIQKIEDTAHQEYNKDEFKDPLRISNAIAAGEDLFNRENVKFEICAPPQKAVVKYI